MQNRKNIKIKKKESQKSYLEDMQLLVTAVKVVQVRKSFLISQSLEKKVQAYIYQKRTQGDIYYNQTNLIRDALSAFLKKKNTHG